MSEQYRVAFEKFIVSDDYVEIRGKAANSDELAEGVYMYAAAEANKRVAELEAKVSELDGMLGKRNLNKEHEYLQRMNELQASNHTLREELSDARHEVFELTISRNYEAAISKAVQLYHKMSTSPETPAESLQAFENAVIEKVAVHLNENFYGDAADEVRALKQEVK